MTLISVVITLIVIGVLLWLVNTYIPMEIRPSHPRQASYATRAPS